MRLYWPSLGTYQVKAEKLNAIETIAYISQRDIKTKLVSYLFRTVVIIKFAVLNVIYV